MLSLEVVLFAIAAVAALRTLLAMMRRRAARLVEEVQKQVDLHREREKERKREARRRAMNKAA